MHCGELKGSFHDAIGPILKIVQIIGIMPVDGVNGKDISNINFKWKSLKTVQSLLFLICGVIESVLCLRLVTKSGMTLGLSSAISFYVTSMVGAIFIFKLAVKWKEIMKFWYEREKVFLKFPYTVCGISLKRRIRLWAALIGFLSLCND
jgi:Trehalose receptor